MTDVVTPGVLSGAPGVLRTELPGGLRVVTEAVAGVRSVSLGIWIGIGSRDESPEQAGAAHYLEHLLFKGTRRRTAKEIADIDNRGKISLVLVAEDEAAEAPSDAAPADAAAATS